MRSPRRLVPFFAPRRMRNSGEIVSEEELLMTRLKSERDVYARV